MMQKLAIWVIDHREGDSQPIGEIIAPLMLYGFEDPGSRYADYCALYETWTGHTQLGLNPSFVGFFGYRKYLMDTTEYPDWTQPAHAVGWRQCSKFDFDKYRGFLATDSGSYFIHQLAQYDILQAPPFPVDDVVNDFYRTRSREDGWHLAEAIDWKTLNKIYPYLFITRWEVFDRMMREMEPIRQKLDPVITAKDTADEEYKKRPMAYIMERVYSAWLANSGLSIKELPLLHCWEMT